MTKTDTDNNKAAPKPPATAPEPYERGQTFGLTEAMRDHLDKTGGWTDTTPPSESFAAALVADLQHSGMTQEQLAKRLHVTQQAVSGWVSGESLPQPRRRIELIDFFGSKSHVTQFFRKPNGPAGTPLSRYVPGNERMQMYSEQKSLSANIAATALAEAAAEIARAATSLAASADRIAQVAQNLVDTTKR